MGLIYKATSPSGKIYVGQTVNFQKRKVSHKENSLKENCAFYYAIRKYGFDNFKWEIVESDIPEEFLNIKECEYIQVFDSYKNGYNSTLGGAGSRGYKHSQETRKLISNRLSLNNPHKGKEKSQEQKNKISNSEKGKIVSEETRKKLSISHIGQIAWNKGKKFDELTKQKMSLAKKGKPWSEARRKAQLLGNKK